MMRIEKSDATLIVATPPVEVCYKGVRKRPHRRYVAEIRDLRRQKKLFWLESYATAKEAARIYDAATWLLRGDKAITNFPQVTENYLHKARKFLEKHNVLKNVTDDDDNNNNNNNYNHILPNQIRLSSTPGGDASRFSLSNWHPLQFYDKYYLEVLKRSGVILQNPIDIQRETHRELNLKLTLAQPGSN